MRIDVSKFIQFDGDFFPSETGNNMDGNVKKRYAAKDIEASVHANATQKTRPQTTDTKLWKIILGIHGLGPLDISLSAITNGGFAEVVEKDSGNVTLCSVVKNPGATKDEMAFAACEMTPRGTMNEYGANRRGSALLAAHIAWAYTNDMELKGLIDSFKTSLVEDCNSSQWSDPSFCDLVGKLLCRLSSNIYYTYKNECDASLTRLRQSDIQLLENQIIKVHFGELKNIKSTINETITAKKGMFDLNNKRVLTAKEQALVPNIPKSFQFDKWMLTMAQDIQESQEFSEPYSVIMLSGPSGTGKTQASNAIAYLLNRPKLTWTADPDADEFKLVGGIMPNTSKSINPDKACAKAELPSFDDIEFDFAGSYQKLFGKEPDALAVPSDCYKELFSRLLNADNGDFNFVKSSIIQALENGWVVEIQEPTVIKRASVLVALNAMLDCDCNSAVITLPTGEVIKRHPEAVVIYTTNSDYVGCQALQQSVLSRIDLIKEVENPTVETMVSRAVANTGCKDKKAITLMAKVVEKINEYCHDKDISDGVCGPREYQSWIKKAMILEKRNAGNNTKLSTESICAASFPTIINHVSQISEDREDVVTAVISKFFKPTDVQTGRASYEAGLC